MAISNQKPFLMLKDYLRDDFSSCSSSGFASFPRRQCCTTVRFLLDVDLKTARYHQAKRPRHHKQPQLPLKRSRSRLQKASDAVINAVKLLPSPSVKKKMTLPKSFSRRFFKSFWRKPHDHQLEDRHHHRDERGNEIRRWRSFDEFLEEKEKSSDQTTITSRFSTSSRSENNTWSSESEGNSESYCSGNDAVEHQSEFKKSNRRVDVSVGEDSITFSPTKKDWPNEEEKEQFSPVSVLDCPFKDEEEINSPFQCSLARVEESKQKLMTKIRRFENLAQLEPVDLEKRIALAEMDEEESLESPKGPCLMPDNNSKKISEINQEDEKEKDSCELLEFIKATTSSNHLITSTTERLLLEFFREQLVQNNATTSVAIKGCKAFEQECLQIAQDWIKGDPQEMYFNGEKDCRRVFIKDMEKNGEWRSLVGDKEEVGIELAEEIFISLVNETLLDLF